MYNLLEKNKFFLYVHQIMNALESVQMLIHLLL